MLVLALQTLSPALWLRRDALTLRHAPLYGHPLIEVVLSRDLSAILSWLGLDEGKMREWEEGFDGYEDVYRWITGVKNGTVLSKAWDMVRTHGLNGMRGVDWKRFHTRVDGLDGFIQWLRTEQRPVGGSRSRPTDPVDGGETMEDKDGATPLSAPLAPSTDPEHPTPLDGNATAALAHFAETHTYDRLLAARQDDARAILGRQQRRAANRERQAQMQVKAAARRASGGAKAEGLVGEM